MKYAGQRPAKSIGCPQEKHGSKIIFIDKPNNLVIRFSAPMVNQRAPDSWPHSSEVVKTATPAVQRQNKIMNARIADNVGTPQLKQFLMVNIKTKFLREYTDQAISFGTASTDDAGVRPGPGHKLQAPSSSNLKRQASSPKHKGSSFKPQAASSWTLLPGKSFKHL
jgi:hypothetical protein